MGLFFFYKPLNKTTKLVSSSTIWHPCQLVQSLLGWRMCLWMGMEILGLPVLWQDHFQWRGEHHPDVGTIQQHPKMLAVICSPPCTRVPSRPLFSGELCSPRHEPLHFRTSEATSLLVVSYGCYENLKMSWNWWKWALLCVRGDNQILTRSISYYGKNKIQVQAKAAKERWKYFNHCHRFLIFNTEEKLKTFKKNDC